MYLYPVYKLRALTCTFMDPKIQNKNIIGVSDSHMKIVKVKFLESDGSKDEFQKLLRKYTLREGAKYYAKSIGYVASFVLICSALMMVTSRVVENKTPSTQNSSVRIPTAQKIVSQKKVSTPDTSRGARTE